jgi:hypothetical protein
VNANDVQVDVDGIDSQTQFQVRAARLHEIIARATAILGELPTVESSPSTGDALDRHAVQVGRAQTVLLELRSS